MRRRIFAVALCLILSACAAAAPALTPEAAIKVFQSSGLPVTNVTTTDVLLPEVQNAAPSCQSARFDAKGEDGIRIVVCGSESDAAKVKKYYDVLGESNALFFSHTFQRGNVMLQGSGGLDKALFDSYVAALPK